MRRVRRASRNRHSRPIRFIAIPRGREAENLMAANQKTRISHQLAFTALFACLAVPAAAQGVPLPSARPPATLQPNTTGTVIAPAAKPFIPPQAQVTQSPNPIANPFAALLGKPSSSGTLSAEQRVIIDRVNG